MSPRPTATPAGSCPPSSARPRRITTCTPGRRKICGGLINFYLHYGTFERTRISSLYGVYRKDTSRNKFRRKIDSARDRRRARNLPPTTCLRDSFDMARKQHPPRKTRNSGPPSKDFQILSGMARLFLPQNAGGYQPGFLL